MQSLDNNTKAFFALLRAGLWEEDVRLTSCEPINFSEVYRIAEEQSVVGLIAAGIEHVSDIKIPKEDVLQFAGNTLQLEQRNLAMNRFLGDIIDKLRNAGIYTLIVKGQGVAQCYERPLWRASGDIDFFLSEENFIRAREFLRPLVANGYDPSFDEARNISAQITPWDIELHGNQFCALSKRMDSVLEEVQKDIFYGGNVRSWMNDKTQVFLPGINDDILFVFTHFLKHFYKGGLGLRQICDWCRLLWTYRNTINLDLLESRLKKMGLMSEWRAFGAYAVDYLGMPKEAMPLYIDGKEWSRKADRINKFILAVGNMGHNRDNKYYVYKSFIVRKALSFGRRLGDLCNHAMIFPLDSLRFFPSIVFNGIKSAAKGVG